MTASNSLKRIGYGLAAAIFMAVTLAPSAPATADGMVGARAPAKPRHVVRKRVAPVPDSYVPSAPAAGSPLYGYYPYGHHYPPALAYYYPPVPAYYYPPSRSCWAPHYARYYPC